MAVKYSPDSELGKELRKWEQHNTIHSLLSDNSFAPGNPYQYRPYPKMLYRAMKKDNGKVVCMEPLPEPTFYRDPGEFSAAYAEAQQRWNACHRFVHDEAQERLAKGQGWCESPAAALEQFEREEQALGNAAAEAAWQAQRMSEQARAEFTKAQADTPHHVTDVVSDKKRKSRAANADEE